MMPRLRARAFTLIEVLVVVAIIALLVAVLIPSLAQARERARIVKCTTNQSNLPKALLIFAAEHKGYGQLISAPEDEPPILDPSRSKYEWQMNMFGASAPRLKPWPLALASALGEKSLKRAEQYFELQSGQMPKPASYYQKKFGTHEIFLCPSDKLQVANVWSPVNMYCNLSYAPNEDVLGNTRPMPLSDAGEGQPWAADPVTGVGRSDRVNPPTGPRAKRLEGRMDRIVRPSEVVMFCDGGNEDHPDYPTLLITNGNAHGPYLENYEYSDHRLPHFRHSNKGGIVCGRADGSGAYLKPLRFVTIGGIQYVQQYSPRVRISPYKVGTIPAQQP